MGSTNAERQRRYRAHKRGDHALCRPERCPSTHVTGEAVTGVTRERPSPAPPAETTVDRRGDQLRRELLAAHTGDPLAGVLVEEACRIVDRLDQLDRVLRGDAEAWMHVALDDTTARVVIDSALAEARQQALALKQIASELRQGKGSQGKGAQGVNVLDQLAEQRKARRANAAS